MAGQARLNFRARCHDPRRLPNRGRVGARRPEMALILNIGDLPEKWGRPGRRLRVAHPSKRHSESGERMRLSVVAGLLAPISRRGIVLLAPTLERCTNT
jgi:hypothetical protein